MKALILNSGIGNRMGELTKDKPKCLVELASGETILKRQITSLLKYGIQQIVMTTGPFEDLIKAYVVEHFKGIDITFVHNCHYDTTNYIYSIYKARQELEDSIILLHGDLVYEEEVLRELLEIKESAMIVDSTLPLPDKDFKAVIHENRIIKIGINFFEAAQAAQPLYKLEANTWKVWLEKIITYCEQGTVTCYAEEAYNEIADNINVKALDIKGLLCQEVDTEEDLHRLKDRLELLEEK